MGDRAELKEQVVLQWTGGRTTHVSEMSAAEYRRCCDALEERSGYKDKLRRERSVCLRLMQGLGVDTGDWARVDAFCMDRRIAGKKFSWLSCEELRRLGVKLRAIRKHGGLRRLCDGSATAEMRVECMVMGVDGSSLAN